LFCYIHRDMGSPQWADVGMYLQTVMLLLRAEGLHSCPQMAWSVYRKTVAKVLSPPEGFILFCGVSIGYEDEAVNHAPTGRAPLEETVTFLAYADCVVPQSPHFFDALSSRQLDENRRAFLP
jgi:nitroreductase